MKTLIFAFFVAACGFVPLHSDTEVPCHQLYCDYYWWQYEHDPNNTCTNPDSVYVDTCRTSPTFEHQFAKRWFNLLFSKNDILPLPSVPADSIVEVTWGSISITYPSIRARFSELEQQFGRFYLRREYPEYPPTDNLSALFLVRFEQRVEVEAVEDFINDRTEHTDMVYIDKNGRVTSVAPFPEPAAGETLVCYPNPARDEITVTINKPGVKSSITIADMTGRIVTTIPVSGMAMPQTVTVPVDNLSAGMYMVVWEQQRRLIVVTK